MNIKKIPFCLVFALAAAGCSTMTAEIKSGGQLAQSDKDFASSAYQLAQFDAQESRLAATKASDPRVADFSSQIVAQTTVFSPELKDDLAAQGVRPPRLSPDLAGKVDALKGMTGPAFDRQYLADQTEAHTRVLKVLQQEDAGTKNSVLRGQAETIMPAVQGDMDKLNYLSGDFNQTHS